MSGEAFLGRSIDAVQLLVADNPYWPLGPSFERLKTRSGMGVSRLKQQCPPQASIPGRSSHQSCPPFPTLPARMLKAKNGPIGRLSSQSSDSIRGSGLLTRVSQSAPSAVPRRGFSLLPVAQGNNSISHSTPEPHSSDLNDGCQACDKRDATAAPPHLYPSHRSSSSHPDTAIKELAGSSGPQFSPLSTSPQERTCARKQLPEKHLETTGNMKKGIQLSTGVAQLGLTAQEPHLSPRPHECSAGLKTGSNISASLQTEKALGGNVGRESPNTKVIQISAQSTAENPSSSMEPSQLPIGTHQNTKWTHPTSQKVSPPHMDTPAVNDVTQTHHPTPEYLNETSQSETSFEVGPGQRTSARGGQEAPAWPSFFKSKEQTVLSSSPGGGLNPTIQPKSSFRAEHTTSTRGSENTDQVLCLPSSKELRRKVEGVDAHRSSLPQAKRVKKVRIHLPSPDATSPHAQSPLLNQQISASLEKKELTWKHVDRETSHDTAGKDGQSPPQGKEFQAVSPPNFDAVDGTASNPYNLSFTRPQKRQLSQKLWPACEAPQNVNPRGAGKNPPPLDSPLELALQTYAQHPRHHHALRAFIHAGLSRQGTQVWQPNNWNSLPLDELKDALLPQIFKENGHSSSHKDSVKNLMDVSFKDLAKYLSSEMFEFYFSPSSNTMDLLLKKDYTPMGLIYRPLIKTLRQLAWSNNSTPTSEQISQSIQPRLKHIQPSQLVRGATSLQEYIQAAEHDGVVHVSVINSSAFSPVQVHIELTKAWKSCSRIVKSLKDICKVKSQKFGDPQSTIQRYKKALYSTQCSLCGQLGHYSIECQTYRSHHTNKKGAVPIVKLSELESFALREGEIKLLIGSEDSESRNDFGKDTNYHFNWGNGDSDEQEESERKEGAQSADPTLPDLTLSSISRKHKDMIRSIGNWFDFA